MSKKLPHDWSVESLFNKSQRYATLMLEQDRNNWQFGFWSALTLEMLSRAALSSISPTLIADGKDWSNIYYALGNQPTAAKFTPKSAAISDVLARAHGVFPNFTKEMLNFTVLHIERRNSEVHSGAMPFDGLGTSQWLPNFYEVCKVLLDAIGMPLEVLFGEDEALAAETLIEGLQDEASKTVKKTITAHQVIWENMDASEKKKLSAQASIIASRNLGHRVKCPACRSDSLLYGSSIGAPNISIKAQTVIERKSMLPSAFECSACGLKVSGYSKLNACGLGDAFTQTSYSDAAEYFGALADDGWFGIEEDNNEP